jgi:hypothetical protein
MRVRVVVIILGDRRSLTIRNSGTLARSRASARLDPGALPDRQVGLTTGQPHVHEGLGLRVQRLQPRLLGIPASASGSQPRPAAISARFRRGSDLVYG